MRRSGRVNDLQGRHKDILFELVLLGQFLAGQNSACQVILRLTEEIQEDLHMLALQIP